MNSYQFAKHMIDENITISYEDFMNKAIGKLFNNNIGNSKFIEAFNDFSSFEGFDNQYCINFTAAWQKYALDGRYDRMKTNSRRFI
jgi:hypothetical protein